MQAHARVETQVGAAHAAEPRGCRAPQVLRFHRMHNPLRTRWLVHPRLCWMNSTSRHHIPRLPDPSHNLNDPCFHKARPHSYFLQMLNRHNVLRVRHHSTHPTHSRRSNSNILGSRCPPNQPKHSTHHLLGYSKCLRRRRVHFSCHLLNLG